MQSTTGLTVFARTCLRTVLRLAQPRHPAAGSALQGNAMSRQARLVPLGNKVDAAAAPATAYPQRAQRAAPSLPRSTPAQPRPVRVLVHQQGNGACRLVISGRMADVCAELDRLALH